MFMTSKQFVVITGTTASGREQPPISSTGCRFTRHLPSASRTFQLRSQSFFTHLADGSDGSKLACTRLGLARFPVIAAQTINALAIISSASLTVFEVDSDYFPD